MSYSNPRMNDLNKPLMQVMIDFAEGNPGAITALIDLVKNTDAIDPDNALGPFGVMASLDNLDCYGPRIWMFYKDVCGHNVNTMLGLMRATQLGFTSDRKVNAAIDGDRAALDIPALLAKVKERLPAFEIEPRAA